MTLDPTSDFWSNLQLRAVHKEEYPDTPSEVMWALYLIFHPSSEYYEMPLKSRISLVTTDIIGKEYDVTPHTPTIEKIQQLSLTKTQYALFNWEKKLEERDQFIASQPYDFSTYEALDKMMAQTSKLWDQYFSLVKQLEKDQGKTRGDVEESLSDRGII